MGKVCNGFGIKVLFALLLHLDHHPRYDMCSLRSGQNVLKSFPDIFVGVCLFALCLCAYLLIRRRYHNCISMRVSIRYVASRCAIFNPLLRTVGSRCAILNPLLRTSLKRGYDWGCVEHDENVLLDFCIRPCSTDIVGVYSVFNNYAANYTKR